jgi:DNA invertase Pin-like site-specific DNA recombinase
MTTRPTLLGYVRADALSCAEELAAATDALVAFASAEGFTLGTVYTERDSAESAAFNALLEEVKRSDVRAVVVPTMNHLGTVDTSAATRQHLEFHQAQYWAVESR